MKTMIVAFAVAALLTVSSYASAADDSNRTISTLGTQGLGYVQFKEGLSQTCQFGVVYLPDLSQYNARSMMAILIAAQARGALVDISYEGSPNTCMATKISAH